jgi:hypothetical protein
MAHDLATTILELAIAHHVEQEEQKLKQEAQQRQEEDIASHRYQRQIGCSSGGLKGGSLWRNDSTVSLRFSSHDGGVVRWLPIGARLVSSTSKEAALTLIPQMMIQEFLRKMEGSMLNMVWVSLAAGQKHCRDSPKWRHSVQAGCFGRQGCASRQGLRGQPQGNSRNWGWKPGWLDRLWSIVGSTGTVILIGLMMVCKALAA